MQQRAPRPQALHNVSSCISAAACPFIPLRCAPLQEWGSVDVGHPGNSTAAHPDSAFSPVQVALARLEALTDVKPAAYYQHADLYEARSTRGRWAGGVGAVSCDHACCGIKLDVKSLPAACCCGQLPGLLRIMTFSSCVLDSLGL